MKAPCGGASGNRQLSAGILLFSSLQHLLAKIKCAKVNLSDTKPGYSGLFRDKIRNLFSSHSLTLPIGPWRQNFPIQAGCSFDDSTCFDPIKTRVNSLKFACARINSATAKIFFAVKCWLLLAIPGVAAICGMNYSPSQAGGDWQGTD
jgi:hypothetical protein